MRAVGRRGGPPVRAPSRGPARPWSSSPWATAARLAGGSTWLQLSCAAVVGAGIAIAQTLLPAVVKSRFADQAGLATGIYTAGLGAGGAVAAGVSAPLAGFLGSWPGALASWSVLALAGAMAWAASRRSLALDRVAAPRGATHHGAALA
ncbi:hypothetical protein GCM10020220_101660 [Nonomuraea rubra]|uniref:hypothetical protein n=1 Tax=Nonomuraea rubra TaxID=46180 RepID=UPI0031E829F8